MTINSTTATDGMNVIWAIVQNVVDNTGTIIGAVIIGVVIMLLYVIVKFIKGLLVKATTPKD